jgi:hypothetical protein
MKAKNSLISEALLDQSVDDLIRNALSTISALDPDAGEIRLDEPWSYSIVHIRTNALGQPRIFYLNPGTIEDPTLEPVLVRVGKGFRSVGGNSMLQRGNEVLIGNLTACVMQGIACTHRFSVTFAPGKLYTQRNLDRVDTGEDLGSWLGKSTP